MSPMPRDPETHQHFETLAEYERGVRKMAGLQEWDMTDPGRPFTEEYDPPKAPVAEPGVAEVDTEAVQEETLHEKVERLQKRFASVAVSGANDEPEDAWESLGGGHATYEQQGFLPAGRREDIKDTMARGRGGKLVHRLELAGRFLDIPVDEHGSNADNIERAKDRLIHGQGKPVSALKSRRHRN